MQSLSPFAILQDFDQRCRQNARGLPQGKKVEKDWVGIGFKLNGIKLVARMADVIEILPPPETIRVPGVQSWVKGIANVRGTLIPVLDMRAYLQGMFTRITKDSRVLVINKNNIMAGLMVEEVFGMRRFKPEMQMEATLPDVGELEPYVAGTFNDAQFKWSVFSVEKLVSHDRVLRLV